MPLTIEQEARRQALYDKVTSGTNLTVEESREALDLVAAARETPAPAKPRAKPKGKTDKAKLAALADSLF